MKNLKKLLAVVLVICMVFSLMAVASAANVGDYSDSASIQQTEAVDLFTALGFLQGNNGAFDPTGTITRESAAKIITYMLIGSAKADALKTTISDFKDVAIDRWSAPFIQYCAAAGIINGDGLGSFNPTGSVTGTAFGKMLLTAIGYGKNGEYTGPNWEMNVIADGTALGIFSLDVDLTAPATREQCAQYGFNAYTGCNTVVFNTNTQSYMQATNIDGVSAKGPLAGQQGVAKSATYVVNGVSYYKWQKFTVDITGGYSKEKVLGTNMDGWSIALLSTPTFYAYISSLATGYQTYFNGALTTDLIAAGVANAGVTTAGSLYYNTTTTAYYYAVGATANSAVDIPYGIGRGTVVNFISTNADALAEKVTVVDKVVTTLAGDPVVNTVAGTVTITAIPGCVNQLMMNVPDYASLANGDVVLWYKDALGVYHIEKAASVTGTMTNYVANTSITVDGTPYRYSLLYGTVTPAVAEATYGLAGTTFYFDNGGYLVGAVAATVSYPAAPYVFVTTAATSGFSTQAICKLSDGSTKLVTVDPTGVVPGAGAVNLFYSYIETSTGVYKLTAVATEVGAPVAIGSETNNSATALQNANAGVALAADVKTITKGNVYFLTSAVSGPTTLKANALTAFVYQYDALNAYAYTGIATAPTFVSNEALENIYVLYVNGVAVFVYATYGAGAATAPFVPSTVTGDWVYIMSTAKTVNYVSPTLTTYTYQALVNGVEGTITTTQAANLFAAGTGLYLVNGYDANGYAVLVNATPAMQIDLNGVPAGYTITVAADALAISGGTITADGTNFYILNSAVTIYRVDTSLAGIGIVTSYQMSAAQVNAYLSTGANVDFVMTSSVDASVSAVYIYGA